MVYKQQFVHLRAHICVLCHSAFVFCSSTLRKLFQSQLGGRDYSSNNFRVKSGIIA